MDYLKEIASRDRVGRLLAVLLRLGSDTRMAKVAKEVDLSERDFLSAVAEAEWGGLVTREERDGGVYVMLTSPGQARAEAIVRPSS
jgi:predicted transcriptional regulator